jgi:hypothetical protein
MPAAARAPTPPPLAWRGYRGTSGRPGGAACGAGSPGREGLDDPVFRPIADRDLADGQHRNPGPTGRPEFLTTAYFHTPDRILHEIEQAGFSGATVYGAEGPGRPLRQEWPTRNGASRSCSLPTRSRDKTSLIGFSDHLIAAATRPYDQPRRAMPAKRHIMPERTFRGHSAALARALIKILAGYRSSMRTLLPAGPRPGR